MEDLANGGAILQAGNLFQYPGCRFAWNEWQDDNAPAGLFHSAAFLLIQGLQRVIPALDVDVRLRCGEKACGGLVGEDADAVDRRSGPFSS
jgi:hypothetical protein